MRPTTAVWEPGAGPSGVRDDVLLENWRDKAARAPMKTHVCDSSGQLLKARGLVELSAIVKKRAIPFEIIVVRALSVRVIWGMDLQNEHVKTICPRTVSVLWTSSIRTYANRARDGKEQKAMSLIGNPVRYASSALCLWKGETFAPRSIRAVYVRCGAEEICLLYERPHKMAKEGQRLHNSLAHVKTRRNFRLYLTNLSNRPVNLPKNFAVVRTIPHNGSV